MEKLLTLEQERSIYDSIMPIPFDSIALWLQEQGGERNIALACYYKLTGKEVHGPNIYDIVLNGKGFLRSKHLLPTKVKLAGLIRLYHVYDVLQRHQEKLEVALEFCSLRNQVGEEIPCLELAKVYYDLKQYNVAANYFLQNAAFHKAQKNVLMESSSYNDIGNCFVNLGQPDSATSAFEKALQILERDPKQGNERNYDDHFRNIVKWNLHEIQQPQKFAPAKLALMKEIIASSKQFYDPSWATKGYRYLAEYHFQENDLEVALALCDSGIALSKFHVRFRPIPTLLDLKGKIYLFKHDMANAEWCFAEAMAMRDSMELMNSADQASLSAAFYEANEKEQLINAMSIASLEEGRRTRMMIYTASTTALVALALGILAFLLMRSRKRVKHQSYALQNSLEEKDVLLKEIHHRVKNNLQIISSFIDLEEKHITDEYTRKVLKQGQARIDAMSLIHKNLYQNEDLGMIDMQNYVEELVDAILSSTDHAKGNCHTQINMNGITLDIDTAIPLGLILTEAITNAVKYVFGQVQNPTVMIRLQTDSDNYELSIKDNGKGFPENGPHRVGSMGVNLIRMLSRQLDGDVRFFNDGGACVNVNFVGIETRRSEE